MTQDLKTLISEAAIKEMTPEKINATIEKQVNALIQSAVKESLNEWSDNGKVLKQAVQDALRVKDLDLPHYGDTVAQMLRAQIDDIVAESLAGKLKSRMDEMLKLAPKTAKLSELVDAMKANKDEMDRATYEPIVTCIIEDSSYSARYIYLDEDPGKEKYACEIQLLVSDNGEIAGATFRGADIKSTRKIGHSYGLEHTLRSYFAAGTILEIDENNIDVCGDFD